MTTDFRRPGNMLGPHASRSEIIVSDATTIRSPNFRATANVKKPPFADSRSLFYLLFASILSQISAAMSGPPRFLIARMPVGEVTLISVRKPSITSMPTKSRPRWRSAAHHVGAQVVRRRNAVDRAGELAVDQDDALIAVLHRREELLHDPRFAKHVREQIIERTEIEVVAGKPENCLAAEAVKRFHDDIAMLGAERLDGREVAGDDRRRHKLGKFGDENLFRRVAHVARIVDDQRLRMDTIKHVCGRDVGKIERRI